MLRSLAATLALTSALACGGTTATPSSDGGGASSGGSSGGSSSSGGNGSGSSGSSGSSGAGSSSGSGSSSGASTDGGAPACTQQACGSACCAGTYCWGFSNICLQNGTCPAAGIDAPMSGLCSCDGLPAGGCPTGETCAPAAHGHATFCMPAADAGTGEAGLGALGAPCAADSECAGGLCLGGAFVGGYCTEAVSECDPGLCSNASVSCEGYGGFQDADGSALTTPEICPALCSTVGDCRSGYGCCASNAGGAGKACLPAGMCP